MSKLVSMIENAIRKHKVDFIRNPDFVAEGDALQALLDYVPYYEDMNWVGDINGKEFEKSHKTNAKIREIITRNIAMGIYDITPVKIKSILEYQDAIVSSGKTLSENMEYYTIFYNHEVASLLIGEKGARVAGESNPAYGHGGKFSPYSKKFVKYDGLTEEEKEEEINSVLQQRDKTVEENPHRNPKRPEYYIHNYGMTYDEAVTAVSESQATFSLEKCIEKYGEVEGLKRWQERQEKWMNNLNSKPIEEQFVIIRGKARGGYTSNTVDDRHIFYIAEGVSKTGANFIKVGITSVIPSRISGLVYDNESISSFKYFECSYDTIHEIEDLFCEELRHHSFLYNQDKSGGLKSTETFIKSPLLIKELQDLLDEVGISNSMIDHKL